MMLEIPELLSAQQVAQARALLERAPWVDGRATAGHQSAQVKANEQIPEGSAEARALGDMIVGAIERNALVIAAALPARVFPLNTDLLANRLDFGLSTGPAAAPFIASGQMRALAVGSSERSPLMPEVPSMAETLPGYDIRNWYGLFVRAGTPAPRIARLHAAVAAALRDPAAVAAYRLQGLTTMEMSPETFGAFVAAERAKWAPLVRSSGATPD